MPGQNYLRIKEGFRFKFGGMKLNAAPDSLPPDKYPLAINIRSYEDGKIRTRAGLTKLFTAGTASLIGGNKFPTDMRAYATVKTDDRLRLLTRDNDDSVWLDNGVSVGALAGAGASPGCSMIPFRPGASPNAYMYMANGFDYQKFSAPDAANNVVQQKVGIAEPQPPPEAIIQAALEQILSTGPGAFAAGGTAGALTAGTRVADTAGVVILDPTSGSFGKSMQVSSAAAYQRRMNLIIAGTAPHMVQDVLPPLSQAYTIASIFYFAGTTGRCIVVPTLLSSDSDVSESIYAENLLVNLRRGSLIQIGTEICYVRSVIPGPSGQIAIETSTVNTHTNAELLTGVPAVQLGADGTPVAGNSISALSVKSAITVGIGTITRASFASSPFQNLQPDDYISFGIKIDNLANLNEMKILFDVGDGTFLKDFYYYTVRPSDIAAAVANSVTQLSAAQTVDQRATIDEEDAAASGNQQQTFSSAQTAPGSSVWTQIIFSVRDLTRVGSDDSKNLMTLDAIQFLFNAAGTINVEIAQDMLFFGGYAPDVGDIGAPYRYRVRPRSKVTGVKGNPSPATRYGISPRRENTLVVLPSAAYDPQIDTWDIFRYGGTVTSWRYVGSTASTNATFTDIYGDEAAGAGDELEFDNQEPWPVVGLPNNGVATTVAGPIVILTSTDTNVPFYLPGTLIQLGGQNVYTLRSRPVSLGGNSFRLELVENAGSATNVPYSIQEPTVANAKLPFAWGPDVNGTIFAVGDALNPGKFYFAKSNAPDSAPSEFNLEICPPSEPLLGGEVVDGLSFVGSSKRWWALYPQPDNPLRPYNFVEQPVERGIAAPFGGHCTDGKQIFFWARDGIWGTQSGSLTDADLYNLFPHEGVPGKSVTYNGATIPAPDYTFSKSFRLAYCNGYLYATYLATSGRYFQLTLNLRTMAWCADQYGFDVFCYFGTEQQPVSLGNTGLALNPTLFLASLSGFGVLSSGAVFQQTDLTNDGYNPAVPITAMIATFEFDGGDLRAGEQWGDLYIDSVPAAASVPLKVTPMSLGAPVAPIDTLAASVARVQQPASLGGGLLANFLGIFISWTDDFTQQVVPTTLFAWQPSFLIKPETITDRATDWDDAGIEGAKWIQGFILHADTFNQVKGLTARDADTLTTHAFTPAVQHNGESELAYSFNQPFIAHQVRLEPTDQLQWRMFDLRWIAEEAPESAETWQTQPSSHGLRGFMHLRQLEITYSSQAPVVLSIGVYDGTPPAAINLPNTAGQVQKILVNPTFNKGKLFTYLFTCPQPFRIYRDKCEAMVGEWGRDGRYINVPLVGGVGGDKAEI